MLRLYGMHPETSPSPALLLREDYGAFQQSEEEKWRFMQPARRPVIRTE
jgi:hypothetical protein